MEVLNSSDRSGNGKITSSEQLVAQWRIKQTKAVAK
jgi:hypothetical protein